MTTKGGPCDYAESSDLLMKLMDFSPAALKTSGALSGLWDYCSYDDDELNKKMVINRLNEAKKYTDPVPAVNKSTLTEEYIGGKQIYYDYFFYVPIKTPLALQSEPLPSGCNYILKFGRATPELSLLKVPWKIFKEIDNRFSEAGYNIIPEVSKAFDGPIPLSKPELHVTYTYDDAAMNRTKNLSTFEIKIPFMDFNVRRQILQKGADEYEVRLAQLEKTPKQLVFALRYEYYKHY